MTVKRFLKQRDPGAGADGVEGQCVRAAAFQRPPGCPGRTAGGLDRRHCRSPGCVLSPPRGIQGKGIDRAIELRASSASDSGPRLIPNSNYGLMQLL